MQQRNSSLHWSAELDLRYDRVFSIIDIQEETWRNGKCFAVLSEYIEGGDNSLESRITIPFTLHGIEENLTVEIHARYRSQGNWL